MSELIIPKNYEAKLDLRETEKAIKMIKDFFETSLAKELNLERVSAPLFVAAGSGFGDDLDGWQRKACFRLGCGIKAEALNSLAKWKRLALAEYGFKPGEGLYTDMNGIRLDDELSNIHSHYVDQWDWERVITQKERRREFLESTVTKIYRVIKETGDFVAKQYPSLAHRLPKTITFIHADDLAKRYPKLNPKEREDRIAKEHGAVFIMGIGGALSDGGIHDGRAPDYDDWTTPGEDGKAGLNGDIIVWNPILGRAYELSSMGIRVDKDALLRQLKIRDCSNRAELDWHKRLISGKLPLSIGGGIGQSRLCMFYLQKAHIGEIQASVWPVKIREECRAAGISLL